MFLLLPPLGKRNCIFLCLPKRNSIYRNFLLLLIPISSYNPISSLVFLVYACPCIFFILCLQHLVSAYSFSLIFMSFKSSWCCILVFYYNHSIFFTLGRMVCWLVFCVFSPRNFQLSALCLNSFLGENAKEFFGFTEVRCYYLTVTMMPVNPQTITVSSLL